MKTLLAIAALSISVASASASLPPMKQSLGGLSVSEAQVYAELEAAMREASYFQAPQRTSGQFFPCRRSQILFFNGLLRDAHACN
ncbi:MAG TPA: hypothetical protein VHD14_17370 [Pseudolabrys sp.]|nr:hypothetical protein [Pseudolabrys sp.]